ncbi:MAG: nickel pincer cofactor biosynthesis protein LarC [Thermoleophilia bacterium]
MTSPVARLLYVDPWSGVAGDMLLGALLEVGDGLGAALEPVLRERVDALGLSGVEVVREKGVEGGFVCSRVRVEVREEQPARSPEDVVRIIEEAHLPEEVGKRAIRSIRRLAAVEARLHGVPVEEVHLHELGAADTLVDVVGVLALVHCLGVERVVSGPVPLGGGEAVTEHGALGVPAPATAALLEGAPVKGGPVEGELTTPTGALLVSELAESWGPLPAMRISAAGFGAGTRRLPGRPNVVRVLAGEDEPGGAGPPFGPPAPGDSCLVVTTSVDDVTGYIMGHLLGRLLEGGARDAYWTPIVMKKSRPGAELTLICEEGSLETLIGLVVQETGTLGLRIRAEARRVLERDMVKVDVQGLGVAVKIGRIEDRVITLAPEYEDCRRAAAALGVGVREVMDLAREEARRLIAQQQE